MPFAESGTTPHQPSVPVTSGIHVPSLRRPRPGISSDTVKAGFTKPGIAQREKATAESLPDPHLLTAIYEGLRSQTRALTVPLSVEDQAVQSMPDASPTKWHLAHTTWFFETFILARHLPGYEVFDENYTYLFNSYYEAVGRRHPRAERGLLTRPSSADITRYRAHVDEYMAIFMAGFLADERGSLKWQQAAPLVLLGCHHEQQHQELLLMDVLHLLSCNPMWPAYTQRTTHPSRAAAAPLRWINYPGGDYDVGHQGTGFAFDNESPRHKTKLQPFAIASRAVTNGEWLAFMDADGYQRHELWLADGWDTVQRNNWCAPQYWHAEKGGPWRRFSLNGLAPLDLAAPVCHISYYEADAYARWAGHRLPTEAEWEAAAVSSTPYTGISSGNFLESGLLEPQAPAWGEGHTALQMLGDVWEWTQSPYTPYPGFKASSGAVGEYNGKFMINQMVLRGGSCVTPASHIRATYRNFFYPHMRWQFAGLRLASHIVS